MNIVVFGFGYTARRFAALRPQHRYYCTLRGPSGGAPAAGENVSFFRFTDEADRRALGGRIAEADAVLVSIPPDADGDPTLRRFSGDLRASQRLRGVIYLSTIGVYGDADGAWIDETAVRATKSERGLQRIRAEDEWLRVRAESSWRLAILRLAGIYGPGRNVIEKLRQGDARRIVKPGQVFNRAHVDDIGQVVDRLLGLDAGEAAEAWNVADDEPAPPQDVIAYAANLIGMPVPAEEPFESASLSPMTRSFYGDNKRVSNAKAKARLGFAPLYPTFREGLQAIHRG